MTNEINSYLTGGPDRRTKLRIIRLPEVKKITGLSRSTIYERMALGTFPKQVDLGERTVGWLENEVQNWLQHRIEATGKDRSWH